MTCRNCGEHPKLDIERARDWDLAHHQDENAMKLGIQGIALRQQYEVPIRKVDICHVGDCI